MGIQSRCFAGHLSTLLQVSLLFGLAAPTRAQPADPQAAEAQRKFASIPWTKGPANVQIGEHASLELPEGFTYTGAAGTQQMMELMRNPTDGSELGLLANKELEWFVLFEFQPIGYVKDADREKLDGEAILDSIRSGNEQANEARRERGWPPINIVGWHTPPFYNKDTNNLEWCIRGDSQGRPIVNYNTRILGRHGAMSANLMVDPETLDSTLPVVKRLLGGYHYSQGKRYAEFRPGDKVAKYGLAALVVGGAVGVAAKAGLLAKLAVSLGKAWKAIILGFIALLAGLKKLIFRPKAEAPLSEPPKPPPEQG